MENKYPIKDEWEKYYNSLEVIRESGITNMFGAAPYLEAMHRELDKFEAEEILVNWIHNYDALNKKYQWR